MESQESYFMVLISILTINLCKLVTTGGFYFFILETDLAKSRNPY